ncbi:MAG: transporter substrate-binding protein [Magnetospirillum sp.]|nr:transporter substrate-binding protein [Magnetospirillum sp.]
MVTSGSPFSRKSILAELAKAAEEIAAGDRFVKVPVVNGAGAEARLARAIEAMRRALIESDAAIAEQEADREVQEQRRRSTENFVAKFETTVSGVQSSLSHAAAGMRDAAGALATQAGTVAEKSAEVEKGAAVATQEAAVLAEAAGQLDQSLGDLEGRVARAAQVIAQAVDMVDSADSTIRGLSEAAGRIGGMAHTISDIAGQTRMLALNATIEAARAGEAGKGFAVVAAEVKSLVAETEKATAAIDSRAGDIRQATDQAVAAMNAIGQSMHEVNELVAAVAATMHQQSAASRAITDGVRRTADEADAMSASIREVADATVRTRAEAAGVREAAGELGRQSDTLGQAVTTFLDDLDHGAIRIGIVHSLSGGSAVGEKPLKDVLLAEIEALNAQGGLLGRPVEALLYNPRSDAGKYAELAERALSEDRVQALFGAWSSTSRKAMLPVLARHDGLLFYPSQYEGAESDPRVVYCGAPPNQQLLPAVEYLTSPQGGGFDRFYLVGNDTLYPRLTHKVLTDDLRRRGVPASALRETLLPVGADDWSKVVADIRAFARTGGGKTLVVSTVGGDSNFHFFRQLGGSDVPVLTVSIGEAEAALLDPKLLAGHMVAWNYLMSVDTPENQDFLARWRRRGGDAKAVVNDAMEASVMALRLWAQTVQACGSPQAAQVRAALPGQKTRSLTGFDVSVDPTNNHLHKPCLLGRMQADGTISILWRSSGLIAPEPGTPPEALPQAAE